MANFMCQLDGAMGCLEILAKYYGCVCKCFSDEINFKYRLIQSTEDRNRTKTLGRELGLPGDIRLFWTHLDWNTGSCVSCLLAYRLQIHVVWHGSLACQLQGLGLLSLHNHVSQSPTINSFRWTDRYILEVLVTSTGILQVLEQWQQQNRFCIGTDWNTSSVSLENPN